MIKFFGIISLIFWANSIVAQANLRGLSVVDFKTAWCSGNKGTVERTCNVGISWENKSPVGYAHKDFRSIYAWDSLNAIILSIADSTVILKTNNGGITWQLVYENNTPGIFFDDITFKGNLGYAVADPMFDSTLNSYYYPIIQSTDYGKSWSNYKKTILASEKDAGLFAASSSNLHIVKNKPCFIVGGKTSYLINGSKKTALPLKSGGAYGPYGMFIQGKTIVIVGGNYSKPSYNDSIICISTNKGKTFSLLGKPNGYKTGVVYDKETKTFFCAGTTGLDFSQDFGKTWNRISDRSYNSIQLIDGTVWLTGKDDFKLAITSSVLLLNHKK